MIGHPKSEQSTWRVISHKDYTMPSFPKASVRIEQHAVTHSWRVTVKAQRADGSNASMQSGRDATWTRSEIEQEAREIAAFLVKL